MTRILVPVDGSAPSNDALAFAFDSFPEATVVALYVIDPMVDYSRQRAFPGFTGADEFSNEQEKAEWVFEAANERYGDASERFETEVSLGEPARTIVAFAEENDIEGIVIGSHGRDRAARLLLGSTAETVVRRAPVPVTVVR